jgi:hypothetical protein
VYGDEFLNQYVRIHDGQEAPHELFAEYDIRRVLIEPDAALATLLEESVGWKKVFQDDLATLFVREQAH